MSAPHALAPVTTHPLLDPIVRAATNDPHNRDALTAYRERLAATSTSPLPMTNLNLRRLAHRVAVSLVRQINEHSSRPDDTAARWADLATPLAVYPLGGQRDALGRVAADTMRASNGHPENPVIMPVAIFHAAQTESLERPDNPAADAADVERWADALRDLLMTPATTGLPLEPTLDVLLDEFDRLTQIRVETMRRSERNDARRAARNAPMTSNTKLAGKSRACNADESIVSRLLCPSCFDGEGRLTITAETLAIVSDDEAEATDITWEADSPIQCMSCGHSGSVGEFTIPA